MTELLKQRPADGQLVTALGVTIDGKPLFAPLDQSRTALVIGVPGTGKTTFIDAVAASLLIQDLTAAAGDPSRYGQLVRLALIETDPVGLLKFNGLPQTWGKLAESNAEAEALVLSLEAEQRHRAALFRAIFVETGQTCEKIADYNAFAAANGLETLPHIVLIFEEAPATLDTIIRTKAKVGDGGSLPLLLDNAARKWRKFGIWPWLLTQKPTTNSVGATVRALAQSLICFRSGPTEPGRGYRCAAGRRVRRCARPGRDQSWRPNHHRARPVFPARGVSRFHPHPTFHGKHTAHSALHGAGNISHWVIFHQSTKARFSRSNTRETSPRVIFPDEIVSSEALISRTTSEPTTQDTRSSPIRKPPIGTCISKWPIGTMTRLSTDVKFADAILQRAVLAECATPLDDKARDGKSRVA